MELGSCPDRHTKRKRESGTERQREREREEGGRGGVAKRMRAAEREGRRGPTEKQEERCLDSFTTSSLRKPYD